MRTLISLLSLRWPRASRLASRIVLAGVVATVAGCFPLRPGGDSDERTFVVRNQGYFDVNVYVVPSAGGQPTRLGTVIGLSNTTFKLTPQQLQNGGYLVVRLHSIGTNSWWTSDAVPVDPSAIAVLSIYSNAFGDCSQSVLRTVATTDSLPPHT